MFKIVRYSLENGVIELVCEAPNRATAWRWAKTLNNVDGLAQYSVIEGECDLPTVWRN